MTKIKIESLKIRNFKGFGEYELKTSGNNIKVLGDNATGKTTLYDAFLFLLFGKDSSGATKFSWKPLDKNNKEKSHLETEVIGVLNIDDKEKKIQRLIKEKWSRIRGAQEETFVGHVSEFRIDGVIHTKKDFESEISTIIGEETFRQLTNVYYVAESLTTKERREMLFEFVGELSDQDVIDSNEKLKELTKFLEDREVDDFRKIVAEEKKETNKQIGRIPDRIDEVDRSIPDLSDLDENELKKKEQKLTADIEDVENKITGARNGNLISDLKLQLHKKETEAEEKKKEYEEDQEKETKNVFEQKNKLEKVLDEKESKVKSIEREIAQSERIIESNKQQTGRYEIQKEELREEFYSIKQVEMPEFDKDTEFCPMCNQELPEEEKEKLHSAHKGKIIAEREKQAEKLTKNNESGKRINQYISDLNSENEKEIEKIEKYNKEIESFSAEIEKLKNSLKIVETEIKEAEKGKVPYYDTDVFKENKKELDDLFAKISDLMNNESDEITKLQEEKQQLKEDKNEVQDSLYKFYLAEKQKIRKDELIAEEKELSKRYGQLVDQLDLLDEFVRTKVSLLTEKINEQFTIVTFKLFEEQINGGLKEVCEPLVNGVPYSSGLNTAARINAGLDIINALSRKYDLNVPIFIDNSESISKIIDTDSQTIQLIVDSTHKSLAIKEA